MKKFKFIFLLVLVVVIFTLFPFAKNSIFNSEKICETNYILEIWQLDMVEGGTSSRQSFLYKMGKEFTKQNKNVQISVNVHTKQSAENLFKKGIFPDVLSFSCGLEGFEKGVLPIEKESFLGGNYNGETYAVPWCVGGYLLFKKKGENCNSLVVSQSAFTNPLVAYYLSDKRFNSTQILSPINAYTKFINGKNVALIGTQRDIYRLKNKGLDYTVELINGFSDIIQYAGVTSTNKEKVEISKKFVNFLKNLSNEKLKSIGMISLYNRDNLPEELKVFENFKIDKTINIFTSSEKIVEIQRFLGDERKNEQEKLNEIKKTLK